MQCTFNINKPKGLKVTKEDQVDNRQDGQQAQWLMSTMVNEQDG